MSNELFHYESCGLPNVCLRNGYTVKQTRYGEAVSIHNLEGLHKAIGTRVVQSGRILSPAEIRFLRKEMDMTQAGLAHLFEVNENTVRNWESDGDGRADIQGPADRLLRMIYLSYIDDEDSRVRDLLDQLAQLNRDQYELECFEFTEAEGEWIEQQAA